jgi:hypothetical protein
MPSKRDVLRLLTRDELISIADAFDLHVYDRRVKEKLVDAVAGCKKATLTTFRQLRCGDSRTEPALVSTVHFMLRVFREQMT